MLRANSLNQRTRSRAWLLPAIGTLLTGGLAGYADEPTVVYQEVLSQFGTVQPHDIVVDDAGSAFVLAARPGSNYATLVLKIDTSGGVTWSQWLDGESHDIPGGIAIDALGDVYVVGTTGSDDFPTLNPLQASPASAQYDTFVVKLSGLDGTQLYGTYLGASRSDWGHDIAVSSSGEMYITGSTESIDFPTVDPIQDELAGFPWWGWSDAYVARISADGSQLEYSTFFGGYYDDTARGITLDAAGRIYIVGETDSDDFPTVSPAQSSNGGERDAFAARISADGGTIEYSTYLGGEEIESVRGIALGADGRLYLDGHTQSAAFPTTAGAYQEEFAGEIRGCEVPFGADYNCDDVFVASLAADGSAFEYATYLGGLLIDHGYGLAVDSAGRAYVAGHSKSDDFPPYDSGTFYSNFVTKLDGTGQSLMYSFLHDTVTPSPAYVALDAVGDIYVAATADTPTSLVVIRLSECGGGATGDMDCDGVVDDADMAQFHSCMLGPDVIRSVGCERADLNANGRVDLGDFSIFQRMFMAQ